jgi:hypothetical protein
MTTKKQQRPLAETPSREPAIGEAVDYDSVRKGRSDHEARLNPAFRVAGHAPEAVHIYTDLSGQPVGAVARYAPGTLDSAKKSFRQFRLAGSKWLPGLSGATLPLYNLPRVVQAVAVGEMVYLAEGERCADLLSGFGVCATTNSGGAGKWGDHHTSPLAGAHVVLLEDDDEPGRAHMDKVAAALHVVAASVRRLAAPGVENVARGQGYDVGDWIAAGGQLAELLSRIEGVPTSANVSDDWPTPIAFGAPADAEPFPVQEALPPMCADLALAIAASVKVDPTAPAAFIPCVLSAAAGNTYSVQVSRSYAEPNLSRYVIWSKPSGERGSQTYRVVSQPLTHWTDEAHREFVEELERVSAANAVVQKRIESVTRQASRAADEAKRSALAAQVLDLRKELVQVPIQPMLFIGDTTSESLVRNMAARGGALAVFSADARKTLDQILGRYRSDGKTDDAVYLLAHGGDCIDRARVGLTPQGELIRIEHPSLAVALGVQPDKLAELAGNAALLQSGFLPRCNLIQPNSLVGTRIETGDEQPVDPLLAASWENVVRAIVDERFRILRAAADARWSPQMLVLDDEAMELRRRFANEIEQRQAPGGDLHGLSGFGSKCAGEAARLAGLFHLALMAEGHTLPSAADTPIPASTWALAERHQRWQLAETLRVLALAQEDLVTKLARRVLDWAARNPADRRVLSPRALVASRIVASADDAVAVLSWLAERGWTKPLAPEGRAQGPRWQVNPVVFGGGAS